MIRDRSYVVGKIRPFLAKFLPALLLIVSVSAGMCQITLVDEIGVIRIEMLTHSRSQND